MLGRGLGTAACVLAASILLSAQSLRSAESDRGSKGKLPAGLYPALVMAIQRDAPAHYDAAALDGLAPTYRAENEAHGLTVLFEPDGPAVQSQSGSDWRLGLRLQGYGRGADIRQAPLTSLVAEGNRIEYRRGGTAEAPLLSEWYVNGPLGLEQGFTLAAPPPGTDRDAGDLRLVLGLSGNLAPVLGPDGRDLRWDDAAGAVVLSYHGLYAYDATGRALPARLHMAGRRLAIHVADGDAVYPLTIDPLLSSETKLTASDGAMNDFFGTSVVIGGDTAIVGAWGDDTVGSNSGAAYVFQRSGTNWTEQAELTASGVAAGAGLGISVAISGDTVVAGAFQDDDAGSNSGSAYVFQRSGTAWSEQAKLTASDGAAGDRFGISVAISGDTVVVGAHEDDDSGSESGSAYVFQRSGTVWTEQAKLLASDGAANDEFGCTVAISSDTVVVGAQFHGKSDSLVGAAYVFQRNGTAWIEKAKLLASDGAESDIFGSSVTISGDTIVVGAARGDGATTDSGSAYIFQRSGTTWTEQAKLTASDGSTDDRFGDSVAISDDTVAVGAFGDDDDAGNSSGSTYVFQRSGPAWIEKAKLTASDGPAAAFGYSVDISDGIVIVGAFGDDYAGLNSGSAYVYELFGVLDRITVDETWKTTSVQLVGQDPVVIAGPPTFHDSEPGILRLRDVRHDSFEAKFQEWAYLDGAHMGEELSYTVWPAGRHEVPDGSLWEAGTFPLSGLRAWQAETFTEPFPAPPALFLTVQTFRGADPVTVRARNVTAGGFEAALFEEENLMRSGHTIEQVGYLAVYSPQGSGTIGGIPYSLQSLSADHRFVPILSATLKLEEEVSQDPETGHLREKLSVLFLGGQLFAQDVSGIGPDTVALRRLAPEFAAPMEWGVVDGVGRGWSKVPLFRRYTDPIVVAKPVSTRGAEPGVVRLRNVGPESFELRYEEWLYLDQSHGGEQVFYLVAEAGAHDLAGLTVEAGRLETDLLLGEGWEEISFSSAFTDSPAVFTSVMTRNDGDPVITRVADLTSLGFLLAMDEAEAPRDGHGSETLGWIAIEHGSATTSDGRAVVAGGATADDQPAATPFGFTADRRFPVVVGDVVSVNDSDPVFLRHRNVTPSAVELFLQEEQSLDPETSHALEELSIFVAE